MIFRNWVLENFPFLEDDFDALTDYELFCKMMEYVKKFAKDNIDFNKRLTDLETYINNLDLQDEVDNKLDKMASDGTLDEIINQEIFGELNSQVSQNTEDIGTLQTQVQNIQATVTTEMVVFGDSWSDLNNEDSIWSIICSNSLSLNLHNYAIDGSGFMAPSNKLINTQITTAENDTSYDKNLVRYVVLCGGLNDYIRSVSLTDIKTGIREAYARCKSLFPNAKIIYVNNFLYPYTNAQSNYWYQLQYNLSSSGITTLNQDGFYKKDYFNYTLSHLTQAGQSAFASNILATLSGGQIKNEGVLITFQSSKGYMYLQRSDNMLLYYIRCTNLLNTGTDETLVLNQEMCWRDALRVELCADSQPEFALAVAIPSASADTLVTSRNQAYTTQLIFKGVVPIVELQS